MHWNHRLIKYTLPDGEVLYSIREVFYEEDGSLMGYVEDPDGVQGNSLREVSKYLTWMRKAFKSPVLSPVDFGLTEEQALERWPSSRPVDNRPAARDTATHGVGNLGDGGPDAAGVPADAVPGETDLRDNSARPAGSPPAE